MGAEILFKALGTVAGVAVKVFAKGVWEVGKTGFQIGKATGNVGKETLKGAIKGAGVAAKILTGK